MDDISERIAALSPEKRLLLQALYEEKQQQTTGAVTLSRRASAEPAPLSFAQQRFWFFDQLMPERSIYNSLAVALRITGTLSLPALEQSWQELVRRHEIFRTIFTLGEDGQPVQVIQAPQQVAIAFTDLQMLPATGREAAAIEQVLLASRQPFDLSQEPLYRVHLIQTDPAEHLFFIILHHIIHDYRSREIIMHEIATLYSDFTAGRPSSLAEVPLQYADFATWQHRYLQGEKLASLLDYWTARLAGKLPRLDVGEGRSHAERTFRGATWTQTISGQLLESLRAFSQQAETTLSMTLLTAFALLLYGYTNQTDLLIGTPISVRNRVELEGIPGCFLNTLVLRADLTGNPTFTELVKRVREETLADYQHQDLPFDKLVEALQPERKIGEMPFFQVAYNYVMKQQTSQQMALPPIVLTPLVLPDTMADIDLLLRVEEDAHELHISWQYRADLLTSEAITVLSRHYTALLERALAYPAQTSDDLAHAIQVERAQERQTAEVSGSHPDPLHLLQSSNLTRNQLLFWMGQKVQPQVPQYNSISLFTFSQAIDPQHFQRAFNELSKHVDILRTIVEEQHGVPMQRVLASTPSKVEYKDLSQESDPSACFQSWLQARSVRTFDLSQNLVDPVLIKIAPQHSIWYLAQHHIITDKWSTALLCRRLLDFYERSVRGELEDEQVACTQFADYVTYERAQRLSPAGIETEKYWQEKIERQPEPIHFYGKAPIKRTTRIERVPYTLGVERTRRLRELVTGPDFLMTPDLALFQAFTSVLFAYLYRISNNQRFSVGSPFQARPAEFRDTIGPFSEARPMHIEIDPGETFRSLLLKVKAEILDVLKHSPYSSPNLNNATYDVLLNYHPHITFPATVDYEWYHVGHGSDSLNVQILSMDREGSLQLLFDFHRDIFTRDQDERVIQHFTNVIDAFLDNRDQPLKSFNMLSQDEQRQLLAASHGPSRDYAEKLPHRLFEQQVQRTPDAIAVVYDDIQLSYAHVDKEAQRLAYRLQTLGAGPEKRVGLCLKRSPQMVIALLGILKTGAAYIPLDPTYPAERLAGMTEAANISILVTQEAINTTFCASTTAAVTLESLEQHEARLWQSARNIPQDGSHLFYVIFTSGSTGKPKGVGISQRGFANLLNWYTTEFALTATDRSLIISSLSFDLTQKNIFAPLIVGGAVHLLASENADIPAISRTLREQNITAFNCTPSLFYAVADDDHYAALRRYPALRYAFLGGEPIPGQKIKRYFEAVQSQIEIVSTYGPTECTDVYSFYRAKGTDLEITTLLPIGKAIYNAQALILDERLQLVPPGVIGELYLAGDGVGIGYVNDSGLTATSFLPHPFSQTPGARIYKTGDQVRALPGGDIEFLSRVDFQVKIRGFRIELAEIEIALRQHPNIREAIVLARNEPIGDKRLIAYLIPRDETPPTLQELRVFLQELLPEYMHPSVFVVLETLPLTANNKIDRQALLDLDLSQAVPDTNRVLPRNREEQVIASIWSELLGLDISTISIHDRFFNLGGHSLLAIQLSSKLREAFDVEIPLISIFQTPTIADLALAVLQANIDQVGNEQVSQMLEALGWPTENR